MTHKVYFITLEETDYDQSISFAIDDPVKRVRSLILLRMPNIEIHAFENEKGVKVSLEGDHFDQEFDNFLNNINISNTEIGIRATYRDYRLDISNVPRSELEDMKALLEKQNHDQKFTVHIS